MHKYKSLRLVLTRSDFSIRFIQCVSSMSSLKFLTSPIVFGFFIDWNHELMRISWTVVKELELVLFHLIVINEHIKEVT